MPDMTAAYLGDKKVGSNELNSPIFGKHPGTAAHVPGAQGRLPKISAKNFYLKMETGATTLLLYIRCIRVG